MLFNALMRNHCCYVMLLYLSVKAFLPHEAFVKMQESQHTPLLINSHPHISSCMFLFLSVSAFSLVCAAVTYAPPPSSPSLLSCHRVTNFIISSCVGLSRLIRHLCHHCLHSTEGFILLLLPFGQTPLNHKISLKSPSTKDFSDKI